MDIAPFVTHGLISNTVNLWLAVPIGFVFGFGLYHGGFTDSRRIAAVFYMKDVSVPVEMFAAIVTGMLGLWILGLIGFINLSQVYFLPTYLAPMAVAGLLFGVGMAMGGFCPGTAMASVATGRIDAMIFVLGVFAGSLVFGDLFPLWSHFYHSDFRGVFRLNELFGTSLGVALFIVSVAAVAGTLLMRYGQKYFWSTPDDEKLTPIQVMEYEAPVVAVALVVALVVAFFPSEAFMKTTPAPYYIIQKSAAAPPSAPSGMPSQTGAQPAPPPLPAHSQEGC